MFHFPPPLNSTQNILHFTQRQVTYLSRELCIGRSIKSLKLQLELYFEVNERNVKRDR